MSTILELWQANRKDYSDNFKVTLSLWINLLFAIVFYFTIAAFGWSAFTDCFSFNSGFYLTLLLL